MFLFVYLLFSIFPFSLVELVGRRVDSEEVMAGTEITGGGGGVGGGGQYLMLHCHHQNDYSIEMGSNESQFCSFIVRDNVARRRCPQTTSVGEKGEPKRGIEPRSSAYQLNALPFCQTGSRFPVQARTGRF